MPNFFGKVFLMMIPCGSKRVEFFSVM